MKAVANLRIGTRLTAAFALVIGLLVVVAAIGYTQIGAVNAKTNESPDTFP